MGGELCFPRWESANNQGLVMLFSGLTSDLMAALIQDLIIQGAQSLQVCLTICKGEYFIREHLRKQMDCQQVGALEKSDVDLSL